MFSRSCSSHFEKVKDVHNDVSKRIVSLRFVLQKAIVIAIVLVWVELSLDVDVKENCWDLDCDLIGGSEGLFMLFEFSKSFPGFLLSWKASEKGTEG